MLFRCFGHSGDKIKLEMAYYNSKLVVHIFIGIAGCLIYNIYIVANKSHSDPEFESWPMK